MKKMKGFTLVELLVTISIIAILMGILLPALSKVMVKAQWLKGMNHQKETVNAVTLFTIDNNDRYPQSVATIGYGNHWNWREPTMLAGYQKRSPQHYRSISSYLKDYIENVEILFSPSTPVDYPYMREFWQAGENWDNPAPDTGTEDPVFGSFCLYWNYTGYLVNNNKIFQGPSKVGGNFMKSKMLISDYFGYDHWQNPKAFVSSERFEKSNAAAGTPVSSSLWLSPTINNYKNIKAKMKVGFTDGHIESYLPAQFTPMKAILRPKQNIPYPDGVGPGIIFIPNEAK